jgi:uncharacterized protein
MKGVRARSWSPYAVGVALGVLSWFAFATADQGLGITTAFEHTAALASSAASAGAAPGAEYTVEQDPKIGWEWMLVVGVFLGSFMSARLSRQRTREIVPALWRDRFGASPGLRLIAAFVGGAVLMLGARIAQGCTSGHGITGTLQLAMSSWIFIVVAFGVAVLAALALYGGRSPHVRVD